MTRRCGAITDPERVLQARMRKSRRRRSTAAARKGSRMLSVSCELRMISGVAEITSRMRGRQLGVAGRKLLTAEDAEIFAKGFHQGTRGSTEEIYDSRSWESGRRAAAIMFAIIQEPNIETQAFLGIRGCLSGFD